MKTYFAFSLLMVVAVALGVQVVHGMRNEKDLAAEDHDVPSVRTTIEISADGQTCSSIGLSVAELEPTAESLRRKIRDCAAFDQESTENGRLLDSENASMLIGWISTIVISTMLLIAVFFLDSPAVQVWGWGRWTVMAQIVPPIQYQRRLSDHDAK